MEETPDAKKTLAERLLEFEMWTDGQTFRDMEYSIRRNKKKHRRKQRRKHVPWKKLYLPALLAMLAGFVLTLCATLQSLGGDSILWQAREVLVVIGPILLGIGFLVLLVAAACTFEHEERVEEKPAHQLSRYLGFTYRNQSSTSRADSMDTENLPIPDDLDPNKNYMEAKPPSSARGGSVSRQDSTSSTVFHDDSSNYTSTARWVDAVSVPHSNANPGLTRQNSDSNILSSSGRCQCHVIVRRSLRIDSTDGQDNIVSQCDLHGICTRSLTSSGYHSASDSTTGTVDCHTVAGNSSRSRHSCSDVLTKTSESSSSKGCPHVTERCTGSDYSGTRRAYSGCSEQRGRNVSSKQQTSSRHHGLTRGSSSSSVGSSLAEKQKRAAVHRYVAKSKSDSGYIPVQHKLPSHLRKTAPSSLPGLKDQRCVVQSEGTSPRSVLVGPAAYTRGSVRCTAV